MDSIRIKSLRCNEVLTIDVADLGRLSTVDDLKQRVLEWRPELMEGWVHDDPETHDRGAKLLYFGKVLDGSERVERLEVLYSKATDREYLVCLETGRERRRRRRAQAGGGLSPASLGSLHMRGEMAMELNAMGLLDHWDVSAPRGLGLIGPDMDGFDEGLDLDDLENDDDDLPPLGDGSYDQDGHVCRRLPSRAMLMSGPEGSSTEGGRSGILGLEPISVPATSRHDNCLSRGYRLPSREAGLMGDMSSSSSGGGGLGIPARPLWRGLGSTRMSMVEGGAGGFRIHMIGDPNEPEDDPSSRVPSGGIYRMNLDAPPSAEIGDLWGGASGGGACAVGPVRGGGSRGGRSSAAAAERGAGAAEDSLGDGWTFCAMCSEDNPKWQCSGCRHAAYCSEACQRNHWREHKVDCSNNSGANSSGAGATRGQGGDRSLGRKGRGGDCGGESDSDDGEECGAHGALIS